MVVEDGEEGLKGSDPDPGEAHHEYQKDKHYTPAETLYNDDDQRWQCPSWPAPSAPWLTHFKSKFSPPSLGKTQHSRPQPQPQPLRRRQVQLMMIPDNDS